MNTKSNVFEYIHPKIEEVLDIRAKDFTLMNLAGFNSENKLYHPKDVVHYIRYAICTQLSVSLSGFEFEAMSDSHNVKFRLKSAKGSDNYVEVFKKSYVNNDPSTRFCESLVQHVDLWTITNNTHNFRKVQAYVDTPNNPQKGEYINNLRMIYNARILGFSPKEILMLNLKKKYSGSKSLIQHLESIENIQGTVEFNSKQLTDFYYKLNKKIKDKFRENIKLDELSDERTFEISEMNTMEMSDHLGLFHFSDSFIEFIEKNCSSMSSALSDLA